MCRKAWPQQPHHACNNAGAGVGHGLQGGERRHATVACPTCCYNLRETCNVQRPSAKRLLRIMLPDLNTPTPAGSCQVQRGQLGSNGQHMPRLMQKLRQRQRLRQRLPDLGWGCPLFAIRYVWHMARSQSHWMYLHLHLYLYLYLYHCLYLYLCLHLGLWHSFKHRNCTWLCP